MREECGVFGVFGNSDAANLTFLGLYALQHRGQESAGIATSHNGKFKLVKEMGLVSEIFNHKILSELNGNISIGHVRYSTTGSSHIKNAQPFLVDTSKGTIAIAHNGNLVNSKELHDELKSEGAIFQSTLDSEIIVHLISRSKHQNIIDAFMESLNQVKGAYSLVLLASNSLIAARDPYGFRPLCLGKLKDSYIVASETCALDLIQAEYVRDLEPGEILIIDKDGLKTIMPFSFHQKAFCIFEFIYFARPDSSIFGKNVHEIRKAFGRQLAKEHPVKADLVMAVPDSGNCAALGYSEESQIPFEIGMIRNHYIGRTFIQPSQEIRDLEVKIKLNPIKEIIKGKDIIVIDDSIVRGTTSRQRVKTLRDAGAKKIHLRISSPPITGSCFFGIDTPKREKLIASSKKIEEIMEYIGADSLGYLSLEGLIKASGFPKENFCTACFSGEYPIKFRQGISKTDLERKKYIKC
jgi:amidophosphoribosyltransferase